MPQVPPQVPFDTTAVAASPADRSHPVAAPTPRDSTVLCSARRPPPASENALALIFSHIPITRCRPKTTTSPGCAARCKTKIHARSAARIAIGRAPDRKAPRTPCACPSGPPPDKSASLLPVQTPILTPTHAAIAAASPYRTPATLRSVAPARAPPSSHCSPPGSLSLPAIRLSPRPLICFLRQIGRAHV